MAKRDDIEVLYYEVPAAMKLKERILARAKANGRSAPQEAARLLDEALASAGAKPKKNSRRV